VFSDDVPPVILHVPLGVCMDGCTICLVVCLVVCLGVRGFDLILSVVLVLNGSLSLLVRLGDDIDDSSWIGSMLSPSVTFVTLSSLFVLVYTSFILLPKLS
jgi:hypothetical protein